MVRGENSNSLNIHLVWGSVWERNCKDLHRKMKDLRCRWHLGQRELAELGPKVDLSMEHQM